MISLARSLNLLNSREATQRTRRVALSALARAVLSYTRAHVVRVGIINYYQRARDRAASYLSRVQRPLKY